MTTILLVVHLMIAVAMIVLVLLQRSEGGALGIGGGDGMMSARGLGSVMTRTTGILAGMFLDIPMALALLVPLVAPVALAQGADPVHLGIVICFNLTIGLVSPPMGGCLLIVSTVTGLNYWTLARAVIPFVLVQIVVLGVLVFVPEITLFLPRTMGLWN